MALAPLNSDELSNKDAERQLSNRKESVPRIIQEFNDSLARDLKHSDFSRPSVRFGQPDRVP